MARRRLQEAEEEQYRAEEDTAALRAEVERLEALSHGHVRRPSQEIPLAENELDKARAELQVRGYFVEEQGLEDCLVSLNLVPKMLFSTKLFDIPKNTAKRLYRQLPRTSRFRNYRLSVQHLGCEVKVPECGSLKRTG